MNHTEIFTEKRKEFSGLIRYAAKRYQIPGLLDKEDLQQEALIILDEFVKSDRFHPDTDDFRKMFKTTLWHGLSNVLRAHKTQKRDYRKKLHQDFSELEQRMSDFEGTNLRIALDLGFGEALSIQANPEEFSIAMEKIAELDMFLKQLEGILDKDAKVVLQEILVPRSWDEIPEYCKVNTSGDEYWRTPRKKVPQQVIARYLDWPLIRVKRAIKRIRRKATEIESSIGSQFIDSTGLKARRRRYS